MAHVSHSSLPLPQVDVAGVGVGALPRAAWGAYLEACVSRGGPHHHVSMNAAKWVALREDPALATAVKRATSVAADGIGIVIASQVLGTPLPERVPGCDVAADLVRAAIRCDWRVALFGGRPRVLQRVDEQLRSRGVRVVFAHHGFAGRPQEQAIAEQIRAATPHLLLVATGTPRAELFIDRHRDTLQVPLALGVGGTFDVWTGAARRAPRLVQQVGLEWAWRLAGSPRARFGRAVVDSARFVGAIVQGTRVQL